MNISGISTPAALRSLTTSSETCVVTPCCRARKLAIWTVGPSASGSLKGTPSSSMSAPDPAITSARVRDVSRSGKPMVT